MSPDPALVDVLIAAAASGAASLVASFVAVRAAMRVELRVLRRDVDAAHKRLDIIKAPSAWVATREEA